MKLYARTLLFFLGVIGFQAFLTAGLIIGLVSRDSQADARRELREESSQVYANYGSWIRILWKSAVFLDSDPEVSRLLADAVDYSGQIRMRDGIRDQLKDTGIDSFVIRNNAAAWLDYQVLEDAYPKIRDFSLLHSSRNHPYVSLKYIEDAVYLTATVELDGGTELFLLKHLDEDFYNHLSNGERSAVFVSRDKAGLAAVAESSSGFSEVLRYRSDTAPYREFFDYDTGRGHFNFSLQVLTVLEGGDTNEHLYLAVFLSDEPFRRLLLNIARIVLLVSGVTVLITAFLALYSSGRISVPINRLIEAMGRIRSGEYDVAVPDNALGEVRNLLKGFNEMALHLKEDRLTMDANFREITFLKEYNETIIHSMRAGILVVDANLRIEMVNGFFLESFPQQVSPLNGVSLKQLELPVVDAAVYRSARQIASGALENWHKTKRSDSGVWDLKLYPLAQVAGKASGKCVIELDDISRKIELEEKILQAEKLSSLSFLSAGIAHEINNPLASILTNVQNLQYAELSGEHCSSLLWIEQETRRIARIIKDLLDFAHTDAAGELDTDVNATFADVVRLTRYGMSPDSDIQIELLDSGELPRVNIPPNELKQVILNLLRNSIHALGNSGRVRIKAYLKKPKTVAIEVEDNGTGIAPEVLGRIFDPFFTTKADGGGTGLGLSVVYGIMSKNGGKVDVKSRLNKGTTITLTVHAGDITEDA